jgi:hypothetical protein
MNPIGVMFGGNAMNKAEEAKMIWRILAPRLPRVTVCSGPKELRDETVGKLMVQ